MSSKKLRAYTELVRPLNSLIIVLVIGSAAFLAGGSTDSAAQIAIAALAGGLIGGGANVINDYFDVAIDKINKPSRPLARGTLTKKDAILLWLILSTVGISLNLFLNSPALGIAILAALLLFLYSAKLKGTVLLGNLTVAAMTGLAFVYGAVVIGRPQDSLIPAIFAFLINFAREIVKDIEDMEGDRRGNAATFPLKYGVKAAVSTATLVLIILIGVTFWPYLAGFYSRTYFVIVLGVDLVLVGAVVAVWRDSTPANLGKVSFVLKMNMLLGLLSMYFKS